jgi:hypothetical protein
MKNDNLLRSEKQNDLEPLELESTIRSISINLWRPTTEQNFEISRVNEFNLIEKKTVPNKQSSFLKNKEVKSSNDKINNSNMKLKYNRSSKFLVITKNFIK